LGTGGLVRAYSDATQECLAQCSIIKEEIGKEIKIVIDYSDQKNFKYQCDSIGINIVGNEFGEKIVEIVESNDENLAALRNKAINFTTFEIQDEGKYKFIKI
jgi:putative IMPACT (imprinted ancient) family translation regulator